MTGNITQTKRIFSSGAELFKIIVMQAACAILAFSTARTGIFDDYAPFGIAFLCAVPGEYSLLAAIGAAIGYIVPVTGSGSVRYLAAVVIALTLKWIFTELFRLSSGAIASSVSAFISFLITGGVTIAVSGFSVNAILIYTSEGLLALGSAYFIYLGIGIFKNRGEGSLSVQELTSLIISSSILLISLSSFEIFSISPARVAAVILILSAAEFGHEPAGAIAGLALGLSLCLTGDSFIFAAMGFAFGGLMAGIFSRLGKMGCCVAFIIANGIVVFRDFTDAGSLIILYEVLIGSVLFFIMPRRLGVKLSEFFSPPGRVPQTDSTRDVAVMRLRFASEALTNVSETVTNVSEKLKNISSPEFDDIFSKTELECCYGCGLRIYCWETNRGKTLEAMLSATKALKNQRSLSTEDLPSEFASKCAHPENLLDSLAKNFADYTSKIAAERRLSEVRSVISEQFGGMAQMLSELSDEFEEAERFDPETASRMETALRKVGVAPDSICCRIDKYGRMTAEIRICPPESERVSSSIILRELSLACDRDFDVPSITELENSVMLTVTERAALSVDFGVAQFNCNDNRLCGDAVSTFNDGKGHFFMMISDGMGCGGRAAVDGAMASGLMTRLLKAGFGLDCSLKIVNSAMLFKSTDESLATLDITVVDLFNGATRFFKAGAPVTVIRRGSKAAAIESETLPAGILKNVEFCKSELSLSPGDIIIMMSDGALSDGYDWIEVEAEVWKSSSAQNLADHIADYARRRCTDGHGDDITVLAAIIEKGI